MKNIIKYFSNCSRHNKNDSISSSSKNNTTVSSEDSANDSMRSGKSMVDNDVRSESSIEPNWDANVISPPKSL